MAGQPILATLAALAGAGCATIPPPGTGRLSGRVLVEWKSQDYFIYRRDPRNPLIFVTSDGKKITPADMFTDGGSIPRIFWSVDGLSPWGLGPAYIIHDWLFFRHRCGPPDERDRFTFAESARILAEVGVQLKEAGLVQESGDFLPAITAAVSSSFARQLWDRPATPENCRAPTPLPQPARTLRFDAASRIARGNIVADFVIPARR